MLSEIGNQSFDYLYMDNTFATTKEDFPPQPVAYEFLRERIKEIRSKDDKAKFYIYCYTLGKEEVLYNLAYDFKTKIQLLKDRWHRLQAIGACDESIFTLRELESQQNREEKEKRRERKVLKLDGNQSKLSQFSGKEPPDSKPFIFLRAMGNRPQSKEQVEKGKNQYHFILTGWKGQYNIKHD